MLTSITTPSVYRLRPTERVDGVGDTVRDYSAPARTPIRGAQFQLRYTTTTDGVVVQTDDRATLLIVGVPDLTAHDRVEAAADVWRVDGAPIVRRGLATGTVTEVSLRRFAPR